MMALMMTTLFIVFVFLFLICQHRFFLRKCEEISRTSEKHKTISRSITKVAIKYHEDELYKRVGLDDEQFFLKYSTPVGFLLWKMRFTEALSFSGKPGNALALDVGGGDGNLTMYARKIGLMLICLEISEPKLRKGREKFRKKGIYFDGVVADATYLPFKEETFCSVYCLDVLEHIPNGGDCVKEMYRVLSKEGNIVVTTPCATAMRIVNLFEFMHKMRAIISRSSLPAERMLCSDHGSLRYKFGVTVKEAPYIFHRDFTPYELEKEFGDAGFRIADLHTFDGLVVNGIIAATYKITRSLGPTRGIAIFLNRLLSNLPYLKYLGQEIRLISTK